MSDIDTGIGATIGAAVVGAIATARELFTRKRRRTDPPEQIEESGLAGRVGRLAADLITTHQEIAMLRQDVAHKLDKLEESVDELCIARAKTDELLPVIRDQIRDLRDDLRDHSRRAATNKE